MKKERNIKEIAFEKYQLNWMKLNGYSLDDIYSCAEEWAKFRDPTEPEDTFCNYMEEFGFDGEIWETYEEFLNCEYKSMDYMRYLLTETEFIEYLRDMGKRTGDVYGTQY